MANKQTNSGFGIVGILTVLAVVGLIVLAGIVYFKNAVDAGESFATTYHQSLRTESAGDVYGQTCPQFQKSVSLAEFADAQTQYKGATVDDITFGPSDSVLKPSEVYDSLTKGQSGKFVSTIYRSGTVDVGIALKQTGDTFCMAGITIKSN